MLFRYALYSCSLRGDPHSLWDYLRLYCMYNTAHSQGPQPINPTLACSACITSLSTIQMAVYPMSAPSFQCWMLSTQWSWYWNMEHWPGVMSHWRRAWRFMTSTTFLTKNGTTLWIMSLRSYFTYIFTFVGYFPKSNYLKAFAQSQHRIVRSQTIVSCT